MPFSLNYAAQPILKASSVARHRSLLQPNHKIRRKPANIKPRVSSRPGPPNVCVTSAETNDAYESICKWSVQIVQDWNAVKNLVKVTSDNVSGA